MSDASNNAKSIDHSNGYEAIAAEFSCAREQSAIGLSTVRAWAQSLPQGTAVLDLGCGSGRPVATALSDQGFSLFGIDASPSLAAAFLRNLPQAQVACESVAASPFFHRTFDAVVAIGLLFLLPPEGQRPLILKVAAALNPGGRFLFTASPQIATWSDVLTGRTSHSLGAEHYRAACADAGLVIDQEYDDEGGNHYYDTRRS